MASRSQIERFSRCIDRIALAISPPAVSHVPLYDNETESQGLEAYRDEFGIEPIRGHIVFNRARQGDTRTHSKASGMHPLHCLGPTEVRQLLAVIDGRTRGIPIRSSLTRERGATA